MITISVQQSHLPEKKYILGTLLTNFLGLDFELKIHDEPTIKLTKNGKTLTFPDQLLSLNEALWLTSASLPQEPLPFWDCGQLPFPVHPLANNNLPVLYGLSPSCEHFFSKDDKQIYLGLDILGSCFFMLTAYEEHVKKDRDPHGRFPHELSLAYRNNFLERPLVNEYLEVLWACLKALWPELKRRNRSFRLRLTHDVDIPFRYAFSSWKNMAKEMVKTAINRQYKECMRQPLNYYSVKVHQNAKRDPFNNFSFLMTLAEKANIQAQFYFLLENKQKINANYDIKHPFMQNLMKEIHLRGHYIGLHGSYFSFNNEAILAKEFSELKKACEFNGIEQTQWENRQHYLRWEADTTPGLLADIAISHDSTVGFAAHPGFRAGTCYDYHLFDLNQRTQLPIIERPLIAMDASLLFYLKLNHEKTYEKVNALKQLCKNFSGNFTLLWHNSNLQRPQDKELYQACINT